MLKKLGFFLVAILSFSYLMGLTAGDIAILGLNTDATKSMIFVALTDIPANTTISFTDNGWNASTQVWRTGEGTISWSHTQSISKGTCITINNLNLATISTTTGTVSRSGSFDPSASGDQILAYEGTTAPTSNDASTWLYGFSIENWSWGNNTNTSDLPTALTGASVGLTTSTTEVDNGYFANGDTAQSEVSVSGTKSQLLALFTDSSKYYKDDAGPLTFPTYNITVIVSEGPVISISGTLNPFSTVVGTPSDAQSYTLSGYNLTANIAVTAPTGFEISSNGSSYSSNLSLSPTYNGSIYVRLNGSNITCYNGNINHSSGEAEANLAVNGIVFEPTPANLLLLDNFYYDTGLALKDTRWNSHSGTGTNTITVQSDNLTYLDYPSVAGNCISITTNGEDVNRTFTAQTANSVYASFLVNVTSANTAGDYFIHFGPQSIGTLFRGRVFVKKNDADALSFGLSNAANAAGAVWTDFNYSLNTTYLLVLRYDIVAGDANDVAHLYIDPPITSNEPAFTLTATDTNSDTANIGSIALRQGSTSSAPALLLDGIRVANSWENLLEISEQPPLPVVLTSFMASISNQNYINLTWITQTETGMLGYYIMRNNTNDLATAQIVSPLIPAINSSQPKAYIYTDQEVTQSGTYYYWLQANDMDGTIYVLSFVSIEYNVTPGGTTPSIPLVTELNNVYPNPFNPQLFIPFSLANKSEVKIIIYNTRGQVVKDFALGEKNAGNYRIEWDGTDNNGKAVPNGIYCIRMIAGKNYYQTKAILMK